MRFGLFSDVSAGHSEDFKSGQKGFASAQTIETFGDYIVEAERLGFYGLFLVEHHFTGNGQVSSSLSVLSYLAGRTSKIRLGTGVVVLPWHNPVLLAEQIATIDQLSHGRFDFGVGKGYRPHEFAGFNMSREEAVERYDEVLEFCRKAWSHHGRFDFEGKHWNFENIVIDPPIYQKPTPPIWIGATSEASVVKAGHGGFNLLLDQIAVPKLLGERIATFKEAAAEVGRELPPQSVCVTRAMHIVENDEELMQARAHRAKMYDSLVAQTGPKWDSFTARERLPTFTDPTLTDDEAALIGYPKDIIEKLKILKDADVDYIGIADFSASQQSLRRFAEEVIPFV